MDGGVVWRNPMSKQCWVIKDPKGKLLIWGISKKRSECLDFYCGYHFDRKVWRQLYREGCRCVKVEIAELKEAKRDSKRLDSMDNWSPSQWGDFWEDGREHQVRVLVDRINAEDQNHE